MIELHNDYALDEMVAARMAVSALDDVTRGNLRSLLVSAYRYRREIQIDDGVDYAKSAVRGLSDDARVRLRRKLREPMAQLASMEYRQRKERRAHEQHTL